MLLRWLRALQSGTDRQQEPLSALMGAGSHYEGDLNFEGRVRIDGHFSGRIYSEDCLVIGAEGLVEGDFDVARAVVAGCISGSVRVRDHLLVEAGGLIKGSLDAGVIEVLPGGRLEGTVRVRGTSMDAPRTEDGED